MQQKIKPANIRPLMTKHITSLLLVILFGAKVEPLAAGSAVLPEELLKARHTSAVRDTAYENGLQADDQALELGKPLERELAGGQTHPYQITLKAGQFLHVVVGQRGVDVVVTLIGPDGKQIVEVDSPNGTQGPEPVFIMAEAAGTYRLLVRSLEKDAKPGRYEVKIEEQLDSTPQNRPRINALITFAKAEQLAAQGTGEARRAAIKEYESTLSYWRTIRDIAKEAETLNSMGYYHAQLGEPHKALEWHTQALPLRRAIADRKGEADTLSNIAAAHNALSEPQKALEVLQLALKIRHSLKDIKGEGQVLAEIGAAYHTLNDLPKAMEYYLQALPLRQAARDQGGAASTLGNIASIHQAQGKPEKALEAFDQAITMWRTVQNKRGEAIALGNKALLYLNLSQLQQAHDHFQQSLMLSRTAGDRQTISIDLAYLGDLYLRMGKPHQALDHYNQARTEFRATRVLQGEMEMLNVIARVHRELGDSQAALNHHEQALQLSRAAKYLPGEAVTRGALASFHGDMREPQKAIDHYQAALQIYRTLGDKAGQARMLNNLGAFYKDLNAYEEALRCFDQALPLFQAVGWKQGEVNLLNSYGAIYEARGQLPKALESYNKALQKWKEVGHKEGEIVTTVNLGVVYQDLALLSQTPERQNELKFDLENLLEKLGLLNQAPSEKWKSLMRKAQAQFAQALEDARSIHDRSQEAAALHWLGRIQLNLGETAKASEYLSQALQRWREGADRRGEAATLYALGRTERARGNLTAAREHLTAAIAIAETLREKSAGQQLRTAIYSGAQNYYAANIGLLMELHQQRPQERFAALALEVSERARARGLLDLLTAARVDIRQGVDPELLQREQSLQQRLTARSSYQIRLLNRQHTAEEATNIAKEIEQLQAEYQEVEASIQATSPHYAALTQPQPLTLSEIQQVLDNDTLLLEYVLGAERSFLWAVTPGSLSSYELPKRSVIEEAARRVYDLLTARSQQIAGETARQRLARIVRADQDYPVAAASLSQMLLGPVIAQLGNKRLVIVSDGVLHYIPFAALPLPETQGSRKTREPNSSHRIAASPAPPGRFTPLITNHEIISLPSASTIAVLRRELEGRKLAPQVAAVLADPVFEANDLRVLRNEVATQSPVEKKNPVVSESDFASSMTTRALTETGIAKTGQPIPRLPWSQQEAAAIKALVPESQRRLMLGFAATYQAATDPDLGNYQIVHFATHGLLNSKQPDLSGVLLSLVDEQGRPQPNGILRLGEIYNLRLPAELIVLSACQTALGQEVSGEGLVGLTRGFMHAGAARVLASLWNVNDKATAELMRRFYTGMLGTQALRPAAALRAAQIELWRNPKTRAPYYWGAFTLQGEWK